MAQTELSKCGRIIQVGNITPYNTKRKNPNTFRVYDIDGIAPCINSMGGGGRQPYIVEKNNDTNKTSNKERLY